MIKYSVLIQSTDSYADTWDPFFKLFKHYWPDWNGPVYLATEFLDYAFPGLDIITTKIGNKPDGGRYTWSESVLKSVEKIDTEYILFILDDLFLNKRVNTKLLSELTDEMDKMKGALMYLTDRSTPGPFKKINNQHLVLVDQNAPYRIGALIAMWHRNAFQTYLKKNENPWEFEIYATKRAHHIKEKILCVNPDRYDGKKDHVISHVDPTGIKRGKWNLSVKELFEKHNIEIDFEKRGFYLEDEKIPLKKKVMKKISKRHLKAELDAKIFAVKAKLNKRK